MEPVRDPGLSPGRRRPAEQPAAARTSAAHPAQPDPQVRYPGSRGLYQRRVLPRWPAGRALHHDGQGRVDDRRPDGRPWHSISIGLQYGVPLEVFVNKFAHSRFEPAGFTKNPDIPIAKSIADYIFRWLGMEFIPGYREANAPKRRQPSRTGDPSRRPPILKVNGHRTRPSPTSSMPRPSWGPQPHRASPPRPAERHLG